MKKFEADFFPRASGTDSPQPNPVSGSADKGKRRILIVDDDANSTHLVKILLERSGPYLVLEENDAANADQTAHNFKPDVILLDIVMPKIDGGELATQIEADRELHNTPIRGLETANQNGITSLNGMASGATIAVSKIVFMLFSLLFDLAAAIARVLDF